MNIITSVDDLHWQATYQVNDINISIVQGNGCQGSRSSDTFEVLLWDDIGNIPLSDYDVGSYLSWQDVVDLISSIKDSYGIGTKWKHAITFADRQRSLYPNALCQGEGSFLKGIAERVLKDMSKESIN